MKLYIEDIPTTKETLWHRIKRRLFARPVLIIGRDSGWSLAWYWRDGTIEIVKIGLWEPGGLVEVPKGTKVHYES